MPYLTDPTDKNKGVYVDVRTDSDFVEIAVADGGGFRYEANVSLTELLTLLRPHLPKNENEKEVDTDNDIA